MQILEEILDDLTVNPGAWSLIRTTDKDNFTIMNNSKKLAFYVSENDNSFIFHVGLTSITDDECTQKEKNSITKIIKQAKANSKEKIKNLTINQAENR